jgi:hypothetical protein
MGFRRSVVGVSGRWSTVVLRSGVLGLRSGWWFAGCVVDRLLFRLVGRVVRRSCALRSVLRSGCWRSVLLLLRGLGCGGRRAVLCRVSRDPGTIGRAWFAAVTSLRAAVTPVCVPKSVAPDVKRCASTGCRCRVSRISWRRRAGCARVVVSRWLIRIGRPQSTTIM